MKRFTFWMKETMHFPEEIITDVEKVEMTGGRTVKVENYRGLKEYTTQRVVLTISEGTLVILGEALTISFMKHSEMKISGTIRTVSYE